MFQLLFKYPLAAYQRGHLVLLGRWPAWALALVLAGLGLALAGLIYSRTGRRITARTTLLWLLQAALVALLVVLLWQPALSLSELKPQQNIVAVLVDDSRSMALPAAGPAASPTREAAAVASLNSGLLADLARRFQVRLYTLDAGVSRVPAPAAIHPTAPATRIGESLRQLAQQTADLPLGAVVLLSDGADNSGGLDRSTIELLRSRHLPVHTVGFGSTQLPRDLELEDVQLPAQALAKSRVEATVSLEQHGFAGQSARLTLRAGSQVLATQSITLGRDDDQQTVSVIFNSGAEGAKTLAFSLAPLPGESNPANNTQYRLLGVVSAPHRILYMEGEPRWEYKFIRRAESTDPQVQLVSILRATENKLYRQGLADPGELAGGFPSTAQEMFRYQGLIIGSVEAAYFTPVQQDLIQAFVDRRGGGVLWLGGDAALADGGWQDSAMAPLLPVTLPNHKGTFVRADLSDPAAPHPRAVLAPAGADSTLTRLLDDPQANAQKWLKLPWLMDFQDAGAPKPGATVLADVVSPQGRRSPLLVTENYGRGRTAVLATSGTWRWQMMLPLGDPTFTLFWQQLLRWLVAGTPGQITASVPSTMLYDQGQVHLTAEVRDASYNPAPAAQVQARILTPAGATVALPLQPDPAAPGHFAADFNAAQPGAYLAQVTASGLPASAAIPPALVGFERLDGVAEAFHTPQNRDLLQRLAEATGGAYWQPGQLAQLSRQIPYSAAGVTLRDNLPLWNLNIVFLLLVLLPLAQWFLRRRWGVV
ncbi:MAG: glutamine amidotransferase [Terriglobales bacterium]